MHKKPRLINFFLTSPYYETTVNPQIKTLTRSKKSNLMRVVRQYTSYRIQQISTVYYFSNFQSTLVHTNTSESSHQSRAGMSLLAQSTNVKSYPELPSELYMYLRRPPLANYIYVRYRRRDRAESTWTAIAIIAMRTLPDAENERA